MVYWYIGLFVYWCITPLHHYTNIPPTNEWIYNSGITTNHFTKDSP